MILEICCTLLTALTLNISDLSQTANFTAKGGQELNPLVADLVEGSVRRGEMALGTISAISLVMLEHYHPTVALIEQLAMIAGHGWAVFHNEGHGWNEFSCARNRKNNNPSKIEI